MYFSCSSGITRYSGHFAVDRRIHFYESRLYLLYSKDIHLQIGSLLNHFSLHVMILEEAREVEGSLKQDSVQGPL